MKLTEIAQPKDFDFSIKKLTSLEGLSLPEKVIGEFYCNGNKLTSLEGCPKEVGGDFYCNFNKLTSLKGAPMKVGGVFFCSDNILTSLEGAPANIGGSFYCNNNELTSLEGAPTEIGAHFYCGNNKLASLEGIHKQLKKMNGGFYAYDNQIKSHVLGLLLIEGITRIVIDNQHVRYILNKHLGKGKAGVLAARQELLDLDLDDYAEL